jgi:endogenous inhibitor of DNA gyrase (YacG/DUF329 family)
MCVPAEPITRTCPICWTTFTADGRNRGKHTYCSNRCRAEAGRRRTRDAATANPPASPAPKPYRPEPAARRECPHCGQPVTIVALLTTPQVAQPAPATPNVVPLRAVREN